MREPDHNRDRGAIGCGQLASALLLLQIARSEGLAGALARIGVMYLAGLGRIEERCLAATAVLVAPADRGWLPGIKKLIEAFVGAASEGVAKRDAHCRSGFRRDRKHLKIATDVAPAEAPTDYEFCDTLFSRDRDARCSD